MAAQYTWDQDTINGAKAFYATNPTADAIVQMGNKFGASAEQMNDLWSQATGGNYDQGLAKTNDYLKATGQSFKGGLLAQPAVQGATYIDGTPVLGSASQYTSTTAQNPAPQGNTYVAPTGNAAYTPKFDISSRDLDDARGFFRSNPTPSQIYSLAQSKGISAELLAESYVRTMGGDYQTIVDNINNYARTAGLPPLVNNTRQIAKTNDTGSNGTTGYNNTENVAKANAVNWGVTPDQTVEGRMRGLLSQDNPLVQMAQTQGLEAANQRGLLNSSLGAEAGAMAHYQYAMPIAQADANTFASAARQNAAENTNVNLQNANSLNTRSVLDTNQAFQKWQTEQSQNLAKWQTEFNANLSKSNLDQTQQFALKQAYAGAMDNIGTQYANMYNNIQMQNIDPAAKTSLLDNLDVWQANSIDLTGALYSRMSDIKAEFSALPPTE